MCDNNNVQNQSLEEKPQKVNKNTLTKLFQRSASNKEEKTEKGNL